MFGIKPGLKIDMAKYPLPIPTRACIIFLSGGEDVTDKEILEAMRSMLAPINTRLDTMQEDMEIIKEESTITRTRLDTIQEDMEISNTRLDTMQEDMEIVKEESTITRTRLDTMQEDIEIIKEESTITRSMTNRLLKWAEKADRTAVNVGFDETE